jgi:hypothetical protein
VSCRRRDGIVILRRYPSHTKVLLFACMRDAFYSVIFLWERQRCSYKEAFDKIKKFSENFMIPNKNVVPLTARLHKAPQQLDAISEFSGKARMDDRTSWTPPSLPITSAAASVNVEKRPRHLMLYFTTSIWTDFLWLQKHYVTDVPYRDYVVVFHRLDWT